MCAYESNLLVSFFISPPLYVSHGYSCASLFFFVLYRFFCLYALRTWSFWKGWNFWLFWISKHSNLWLLQIFLFKFQLLEMSVRPLKKSINIFKHDEKIDFLKIWYLDVSWNFEKIDFFSMFFSLATTIATAKLGIFCTSIL